jgi:hypothetical protein
MLTANGRRLQVDDALQSSDDVTTNDGAIAVDVAGRSDDNGNRVNHVESVELQ